MMDKDIVDICFTKAGTLNGHALKRLTKEQVDYLYNRFVDSSINDTLNELVYRIKYNIEKRPICPVCGKPVTFLGRPNSSGLYTSHCSPSCSTKSKEVLNKKKETIIDRYCSISCYNNHVKERREATNINRYGERHYNNREKFKETYLNKTDEEKRSIIIKRGETKLDRYGDANYNNRERARNTCLEKYGVDSYSKTDEFKEKCCCCLTEESLNKIRQTKLNRYGDANYNNIDLIRKTNLERYGCKCVLQNTDVRTKIGNTMIALYGNVKPMRCPAIKEKYNWYEIQKKREATLKKNYTFNKSKEEDVAFELLYKKHPDILRQYKSEDYPFNCDFYIPSLNIYIEYNGSQYHCGHPFNKENVDDIKKLYELKQKAKNSPRHSLGKESQ